MNGSMTGEQILKSCIELLSSLVAPLDATENQAEETRELDDALYINLSKIKNSDIFKQLQTLQTSDMTFRFSELKSQSRWSFVTVCLYLMKIIRDTIENMDNEKLKLLNNSQKQILKSVFQFVISLGILQYLLPGVGVSLEEKCRSVGSVIPENLTDFAKYKRLCFVMDSIFNLYSVDVFYELIVTKHLEDILSTLFQLSFAPLKKPTSRDSDNAPVISIEFLDDNYEIDRMTYAMWSRFEENKNKYRSYLVELQKKVYRPFVIHACLLLMSPKKIPRWMKQVINSTLINLVLEKNGIVYTIKGIVEMDDESPNQSSHCISVAKLISTIFCEQSENSATLLAPQLHEILSKFTKQTYDYVSIQVAASVIAFCCRNCLDRVEKFILEPILNPLKRIALSSEEQIDVSINQLFNLCIVPSNNYVAVSIDIILPVSSILFSIYGQIKDSICYLKSLLKELLGRLLLEASEDQLRLLLNVMVFNEPYTPIVRLPTGTKIVLTSNGGIKLKISENDSAELENGVLVLSIIKNMKENEKLSSSFLIYLLKEYVNCHDKTDGSKRVVIVILLTELSQDENSLKHIIKNSENVIQFVRDLLQIHCEKCEEDENVIRLCLMFLTMVLYDLRKKKDVKWNVFTPITLYLKKLKESRSPDIALLAEETFNLITTRNVIGKLDASESTSSKILIQEIPKSACEITIENACDPLLPVRAHALMELISLIKKADPEALAKKEKIMCLFQENLKDKDSFLYLRAIEGLSNLAMLKPDDILPLLCQEFTLCTTPETRLKIGEILVRAIKSLNEFVSIHKNLLINAFLNGVKDVDCLVRASSLSNLGEVCSILKYDVNGILQEVLYCAQNVASSDDNVEPRRAAIFLIASLFRGLKGTIFKVLEKNLLELYHTLGRIESTDHDEIVRVQARASLNELNKNMKQCFTLEHQFEKRISILNNF